MHAIQCEQANFEHLYTVNDVVVNIQAKVIDGPVSYGL